MMKMVKYYSENNTPSFKKLLQPGERIPELAEKIGVSNLGKIIMAELTKFVNCYTVVRPMNAEQIAQCAYSIIQTSEEDQLSLQDIVIFFEGAKQGKYGRVLDHIDQHVIFEMLEVYRQQRHEYQINYNYEKNSQYKVQGITERNSESSSQEIDSIRSVMNDYFKEQSLKTEPTK